MAHTYAPQLGLSQVKSGTVTLKTTGSPADIGTIIVPFSMGNYVVKAVWVRAITAAATLESATIDVRTAAAGAGASVLSGATALNGLTAAGKVQTIAGTATDTVTSSIIYVRQTVDSWNAGTVEVTLELVDLT